MSEFRFILNGQQLKDHPDGWQDFTEAIVRDREVFGITLEYKQELTFRGDGYVILDSAFKDSQCNELTLVVEQKCGANNWKQVAPLLIKTSDIVTNLNKCSVQAKTTDSSYYGLIHNNRGVPVRMDTLRTKNGVDMTACPIREVNFFKPEQSGGEIDFYFATREGFDAIDALQTVLTFITDGQITEVQSTFYSELEFNVPVDSPDIDYGDMAFMFFLGEQLRTAGETNLPLTFEDIIQTMHTMHGLWWTISNGVLILEPEEYFFGENKLTLPSLTDVTRETDTRVLYASVQLGSPKSEDETFVSNNYPDPINWSMPKIDLIAHTKQEFPLSGVCNTDAVLQLTPAHVIDSNLIEKTLYVGENTPATERPDQGADGDIFYIQVVRDETNERWLTCWSNYFLLPTTPVRGYTFNPDLLNSEVVKRHSVQSDYSLYFTGEDDKFRVSLISIPNTSEGGFVEATFPAGGIGGDTLNTDFGSTIARFNDDSTPPNFNNNNNFDLTTDVFEAPVTSVYGFETQAYIKKIYDVVIRNANPAQIVPIQNVPNSTSQFYSTVPVLIGRMHVDILENDGTTVALGNVPISVPFLMDWNNAAGFQIQFGNFNVVGQTGFPPEWSVQFVRSRAANDLGPMTGGWGLPKETPVGAGLFYMIAGQKIRVRVNLTVFPHYANVALDVERTVRYGLQNNSWFECVWLLPNGGTFEPVNPELHRALMYAFRKPMTLDQWETVKADPTLGMAISTDMDNFIQTHIGRVTRTLATGATEFELIGNRDQPYF